MCCAGVTTSHASQLVELGKVARSRGSRDRAARRARKTRFSWRLIDGLDDVRLRSAHSRVSRPPAAATCASAVPQAPPPMTPAIASCLHPRAAHLLGAARRAASGRGPERRAGRSGRRRSRSAPAQAIIAALSVHSHAGRHAEAAALLLAPGRPSAVRIAGWRRPRRRRPAPARRCLRSARAVRSTRQSTTACWKLAAMSSRPVLARGDRALHRALEAGEGEMRLGASRPAAAAAARPWDRPARASCLDRRAAGIIAGRAAWPPCRTLRRRHRRWSSPAGDSRRRRALRATGSGRPRPAAADRETRGPGSASRGDSAWPSR